MMETNEAMLLGELKGKVESLTVAVREVDDRLASIDNRLRSLELGAAKYGFVAGGIASIALAVIIELGKSWLKIGAR